MQRRGWRGLLPDAKAGKDRVEDAARDLVSRDLAEARGRDAELCCDDLDKPARLQAFTRPGERGTGFAQRRRLSGTGDYQLVSAIELRRDPLHHPLL